MQKRNNFLIKENVFYKIKWLYLFYSVSFGDNFFGIEKSKLFNNLNLLLLASFILMDMIFSVFPLGC
jgi:hypothetical protein